MDSGNPDFDKYPVRVTLCFKDNAARDEFMGGLSDGFGEAFCDLLWPWRDAPRTASGAVIGFEDQDRFAVEVFDPTET